MTFIALQTNLLSESLGAKLAVNPEAFSLLLKIPSLFYPLVNEGVNAGLSASQIDFVPPRSASYVLVKKSGIF